MLLLPKVALVIILAPWVTYRVGSEQLNLSLQQISQVSYKKQEQEGPLEAGKDRDEQSWTRALSEHYARKDRIHSTTLTWKPYALIF